MEKAILRTATKSLSYYYESCKKYFLEQKNVLKIVRHLEKYLKTQLCVTFTDSSSIKDLAVFVKSLDYTSKRKLLLLYEKERE